MDQKFGVINEQGYLGEGFGFTEASEDDKAVFETKGEAEEVNETKGR